MSWRSSVVLSSAAGLAVFMGCGSGDGDPTVPTTPWTPPPNQCVTGGYLRSLATGAPHPALVASVKEIGPMLTNADLVALDALDLRQPLGTLLANESFAPIWYTARERALCILKTAPATTVSQSVRDLAATSQTCPTIDEARATIQELRSGAGAGDVEGSLVTGAAACETAFREGRAIPSVDGATPAAPVPLATVVSEFRQEAKALEAASPVNAKIVLDASDVLERMQHGSLTASGDSNVVLEPLGKAFEVFAGPNGRYDIEVKGQVGMVGALEHLSEASVRYARDLSACLGLGNRISFVLDLLDVTTLLAACDGTCATSSAVVEAPTRSCDPDEVRCVHLESDSRSCGDCENACGTGERCVAGHCKEVSSR